MLVVVDVGERHISCTAYDTFSMIRNMRRLQCNIIVCIAKRSARVQYRVELIQPMKCPEVKKPFKFSSTFVALCAIEEQRSVCV